MADNYGAEEIAQVVRDIADEPHFRERNAEWEENRELVFMQRGSTIPGVPELDVDWRTPDLLKWADEYTAKFLGASMSINISAQGEGPKAEKAAQGMENFAYRLIDRARSQGVFHGPIHDMAGVTGQGWLSLSLNREVLPLIPQQEKDEDPEAYLKRAKDILDDFTSGERPDLFVIEAIRMPETIMYSADRKVVFSRSEVPLAPLCEQYAGAGAGGKYGEAKKGKRITIEQGKIEVSSLEAGVATESTSVSKLFNETVMLYVVTTEDYIYHILEDSAETQTRDRGRYAKKTRKLHPIGCYKNVFGVPTFFPMDGRVTNHPSSQHRTHALTYAAIKATKIHNLTGTIYLEGGVLAEQMRLTLEPMPGEEARLERAANKNLEVELVGDRFVAPPPGYRIVQSQIGMNEDTKNAFAITDQKMQGYGYPRILGQPEEYDAKSGYDRAKAGESVSSIMDPPLESIAATTGAILRAIFAAIKELNIPVTFRHFGQTDVAPRNVMQSITIKPEDIVDVDMSVSFDSLTQYARAALIEQGEVLLEKGRISEDMFLRDYMGIDDPARLKRKIFMEKAERIGEDHALQAASALFIKVQGDIEAEALTEGGMMEFMQPTGGNAPMGGPNTALTQPPVPEDGAGEMARTGGGVNGASAYA